MHQDSLSFFAGKLNFHQPITRRSAVSGFPSCAHQPHKGLIAKALCWPREAPALANRFFWRTDRPAKSTDVFFFTCCCARGADSKESPPICIVPRSGVNAAAAGNNRASVKNIIMMPAGRRRGMTHSRRASLLHTASRGDRPQALKLTFFERRGITMCAEHWESEKNHRMLTDSNTKRHFSRSADWPKLKAKVQSSLLMLSIRSLKYAVSVNLTLKARI